MTEVKKEYGALTESANASGDYDRVTFTFADAQDGDEWSLGSASGAIAMHAAAEVDKSDAEARLKSAKAALLKLVESSSADGDAGLTRYIVCPSGTATVSKVSPDSEEEVEETDWAAFFEDVKGEIGDNRATALRENHTTTRVRVKKGRAAAVTNVKASK